MNKYLLFLIPLCMLATSCTVPKKKIIAGQCATQDVPVNCKNIPGGGPSNPELNFNKNSLRINPPVVTNVCGDRDSTLVIKITPTGSAPNTVSVIPKNAADIWLSGKNDIDPDRIEIKIPLEVAENSDHDYTIVLSNGDCLDPRVHVN